MQPQEILPEFDRYLAGRGLQLHAVVLGGTALNLLGVVFRPTRDCDVLAPTAGELAAALPWLEDQDTNHEWPTHVAAVLADLGKRLGHGV